MSLFVYDVQLPEVLDPSRRVLTVVYLARNPGSIDQLRYELKPHFLEAGSPPHGILFLDAGPCKNWLEQLFGSGGIRELSVAKGAEPSLGINALIFSSGASWSYTGQGPQSLYLDKRFLPWVLRAGMMTVFKQHNAILKGGPTYHYELPSGKHTEALIRVANILRRGSQVSFIGLCLLAQISEPVANVYVDTSAISSVAYAWSQLRDQADGSRLPPLSIASARMKGSKRSASLTYGPHCFLSLHQHQRN